MPTSPDTETLRRLLDLQAEDTAIKRLEDRRASLPEAQRLSEVKESLTELESDLEIAARQDADASREQTRLEQEVDLLDKKIEREQGRLFSGGVSNPKELSSLQSEIEMLKRQRSALEDRLLEVMEKKEQTAATLSSLQEEHSRVSAEAAEIDEQVSLLLQEIDAGLAGHGERRRELAQSLPEDLLKLYDQLRHTKGGVGAAALSGGACQGCHTQLPHREVERLRAEGGLQRCENCRRILVVL
ncbi:MAG TPA: C4-type zinc ribbon domain-containing protein [Actinomycetota bacterium]|jgi:predicted  nucleic acid-binding Zn-ribbon protein|nr:C4-type zinc ribbon domain-containing protein [Actinomycetota bacterium]